MFGLKSALTGGWTEIFGSPDDLEGPPIVNGPAHKNLLSRAFEEHGLRGSRETRRCSFRGVYILQTRRLPVFWRCGGASPRFFDSLTIGWPCKLSGDLNISVHPPVNKARRIAESGSPPRGRSLAAGCLYAPPGTPHQSQFWCLHYFFRCVIRGSLAFVSPIPT